MKTYILIAALSVLVAQASASENEREDHRAWMARIMETLSWPDRAGPPLERASRPWPDHLHRRAVEADHIFRQERVKLYSVMKWATPEERKIIHHLLDEQRRVYTEFFAQLHAEHTGLHKFATSALP
jgi:hypothetical protein